MNSTASAELHATVQAKTGPVELGVAHGLAIKAYSRFDDVVGMWEKLQLHNSGSPFQLAGFVSACLSAIPAVARDTGQRQQPLFIVCYSGLEPVAIYALAIERSLAGRRLAWFADRLCDYNGPVVARHFSHSIPGNLLDAIIGLIQKKYTGIDYAYLIRNLKGHPTIPDAGLNNLTAIPAEHSAHALQLQRNWPELYQNLRSKETRRRFRGKYTALAKLASLRFGQIRNDARRQASASQVMDWKSAQLLEAGDRNPFGSATAPSQLRSTILECLQRKDSGLKLFCLEMDGRPLAGILGLVSGGNFSLWVTAYDPAFGNKYSAGTLLLIKTLELASRAGLAHFDFLMGDEPYKKDWCNIKIPLYHVMQPLTTKGRVCCSVIQAGLNVKKFILSRPAAMKSIRYARKAVLRQKSAARPEPAGAFSA